MKHSTPVLIAGGGIAGMATALSLVNRGIRCMIAEPEISWVSKVGETIPPNSKSILTRAGIDHLLGDSAHLPCYGNHFAWGSSTPYEKSFFAHIQPHGWHLDRPRFEDQLRAHCLSRGVDWLKGQRAVHIEKQKGGWQVLTNDGENKTDEVSCKFLVDASGRQSRIARAVGSQRHRLDALAGISLMLTVDGAAPPQHTFIEAAPDGWWYAAPLSDNRLSVVFMTDADLVDKQMLQPGHFLRIAQTTATVLIAPLLKVCSANTGTTLRPASTSMLSERTGDSWLAVGDAAYTFDPISSYGIMTALEGGYYAGHAITDTLQGATDATIAYDAIISQAFDVYLTMHGQQYAAEQRWWKMPFWERRRSRRSAPEI